MPKEKELSSFDKIFGEVCKCGVRHNVFATIGHNLPKISSKKCKYQK